MDLGHQLLFEFVKTLYKTGTRNNINADEITIPPETLNARLFQKLCPLLNISGKSAATVVSVVVTIGLKIGRAHV